MATAPTDFELFARQILDAQGRASGLRDRAKGLTRDNPVVSATLDELGTTLEELRVAEEELRVQAEELIASQAQADAERHRYQDLFEFAPNGYAVTDAEGVIVEANRALAALVGAEARFLAGKPLVLFVDPADRTCFHLALSDLHRNPARQPFTVRVVPRDGAPIRAAQLSVAPFREPGRRRALLRWQFVDVTERLRAEGEAIALNAELEQRVEDRTADLRAAIGRERESRRRAEAAERRLGILATAGERLAASLDFDATLANIAAVLVPAFGQWCAVELPDADGRLRRVGLALPPDQEESLRAWEADNPPRRVGELKGRTLLFGDTLDLPADLDRAEAALGHLFVALGWRSAVTAPLAAGGRAVGTLWVGSGRADWYEPDDTPLAEGLASRAALALHNADLHRRLRDADRRKDDFLAMLAHELRNPLAPIRHCAHLLRQADLPADDAETARSTIDRQLGHLARLVDDLLDASRVSRGKVNLRTGRLDLALLVRRVTDTLRPSAEARGLRLLAELPPGEVAVDADVTRIDQVVTNLLNNAFKYTPSGGSVTVAVASSGNDAVIAVRDTGVGIAADFLPHVFELFAQAEQGPERTEGGLGIGLTLVRQLIEMHGGYVEAKSAGRGRGSEFIARLPLAKQAAEEVARPESARTPPPDRPRPCRVLVVDDNVDGADSLAVVLRRWGHEVRVAYDGPTALMAAAEFRPLVAVVDIGLPRMDGLEVARRLRGSPHPPLRLIAMSGYGREDDARRSLAAGFSCHLIKPVDPEELRGVIEEPV